MEGYNGTIFAYGQTGSGKTYTIQGPTENEDPYTEHRGVMPRSFEYLFFNLDNMEKQGDYEYLVTCSYLEIYNENIQDLLDPSSVILKLREDMQRGIYVEGATETNVRSTKDMAHIIQKGTCNRHVSCTDMNKDSSRSHAVMTMRIESKKTLEGIQKITTSSFHIIDLAGSERPKRTNATGTTLKEAGMINKSLSTLGNVINCLVDIGQGKKRFVHYRDSKLTSLLRNSLGGNAKTLMIANISPAACSFFETYSTLKFAQRAKMIKNDAVINEDTTANVQQLKTEIRKLKLKISDLELEKASLKCDISVDNHQFMSPNTNKIRAKDLSLGESLGESHNQASMDAEMQEVNHPNMHLSPSILNSSELDESKCDQFLFNRVKKLENIVNLYMEENIKISKIFEKELSVKDDNISLLEKATEEYRNCQKKDQTLIGFRDATISKLKAESGININEFTTQQIEFLNEELDIAKYKLTHNADLQSLTSKCSMYEQELKTLKNTDGPESSIKSVFKSLISLNENTQQYLSEYCNNDKSSFEESQTKRMSNTSFISEQAHNDLQDQLNSAQEESNQLKAHLEESRQLINQKNKEIKKFISKQVTSENNLNKIEQKLESYRQEMASMTDASEVEQKTLKIKVVDLEAREQEFMDKIQSLTDDIIQKEKTVAKKEQEYDGLVHELHASKDDYNSHITDMQTQLQQAHDEIDFKIYEANEQKKNEEHLQTVIKGVEEKNRTLQTRINDLEAEVSDLSIQVSYLTDENEILQKTHEWQSK